MSAQDEHEAGNWSNDKCSIVKYYFGKDSFWNKPSHNSLDINGVHVGPILIYFKKILFKELDTFVSHVHKEL